MVLTYPFKIVVSARGLKCVCFFFHSGIADVICMDCDIVTICNGFNLSTISRPGNMRQLALGQLAVKDEKK